MRKKSAEFIEKFGRVAINFFRKNLDFLKKIVDHFFLKLILLILKVQNLWIFFNSINIQVIFFIVLILINF